MQYTIIINWDRETASTDKNFGLIREILYQTSPATSTEHHKIKRGWIILK
jgi:hypothetical protein